MHHSSLFTSTVTGKRYKIFCNVHCKSANVIYLLHCPICGLQYVGESKQPFHKRLNGHRSNLTKKPLLPVSQHFRFSNRCLEDFNKMQIFIVEQNTIWSDLQRVKREGFRIKNSMFYIHTKLIKNVKFFLFCIVSYYNVSDHPTDPLPKSFYF